MTTPNSHIHIWIRNPKLNEGSLLCARCNAVAFKSTLPKIKGKYHPSPTEREQTYVSYVWTSIKELYSEYPYIDSEEQS